MELILLSGAPSPDLTARRIASTASNESFAFACIELFGRLWMELESVSIGADAVHRDTADLSSGLRLEVLRLELVLLLDACRSARWRQQLDISQRLTLQSTLGDVLESLTQDAIEWAQDRLLDAVLELCPHWQRPWVRYWRA